jgi:hypothetical protein
MKLITTQFRYGIENNPDHIEEAIQLMGKLGIPGEVRTYTDLVLTDEEYFTYWELFDKITHVREVK